MKRKARSTDTTKLARARRPYLRPDDQCPRSHQNPMLKTRVISHRMENAHPNKKHVIPSRRGYSV
jgi:hypothetical protein